MLCIHFTHLNPLPAKKSLTSADYSGDTEGKKGHEPLTCRDVAKLLALSKNQAEAPPAEGKGCKCKTTILVMISQLPRLLEMSGPFVNRATCHWHKELPSASCAQ